MILSLQHITIFASVLLNLFPQQYYYCCYYYYYYYYSYYYYYYYYYCYYYYYYYHYYSLKAVEKKVALGETVNKNMCFFFNAEANTSADFGTAWETSGLFFRSVWPGFQRFWKIQNSML